MERLSPVRWTIVGIAILLLGPPAWSQTLGYPSLDPADYVSPSGEYVLHVDPTERDGAGPADYVLRRGGELVWSGTLPFTFRDAIVTDLGTTLGAALTEGIGESEGGLFVVAVLSDDGTIAVQHERVRKSHGMHSPDKPNSLGIVQEGTRGIVRVLDPEVNRSEVWWEYDLVAKERMRVLVPNDALGWDEHRRHIYAVRPVAGTPLLILHWSHWPRSSGHGALFTLVEEDLGLIWSMKLPGDYEGLSNPVWGPLVTDLHAGIGLGDGTDRRFSVLRYQDGVYATHEVERTREGWSVREVDRVQRPEEAEEEAPTIEPITLEVVGSFVLSEAALERPSAFLVEWEVIDADGTIEGIWYSRSGSLEWRRLGPDGAALVTQSFELPDGPDGSTSWARRPDGAWVLARDPYDNDSAPVAWRLAPESGAVTPLAGFRGPPPERICASADGFVVTGTRHDGGGSQSSVAAYDSEGSPRWRANVFSPEDVAIGASGQVLVLDVIRHEVIIFSASGKRTARVDLEDLWGQEPNYPSGIETAPDGRFLIQDFSGEPPIWVMQADGGTARGLVLRLSNGSSPYAFVRWARFGPDGKVWSSDGHVFHRFDESGVVDRTVGELADPAQIHEPYAAIAGPAGHLYVLDGRTAQVHVFDLSGQLLYHCTPAPTDYPFVPSYPRMSVDGRGQLFVPIDDGDYVEYDEAGNRVGLSSMHGGDLAFLPDSREAWVGLYQGVIQIDAAGKETLRIQRRHDRTWLGSGSYLAVAPDGSLAVVNGGLNLYGPKGESRARIVLPRPSPWERVAGVAYGEDWIAIYYMGEGVLLVRLEDGAARWFDPGWADPENTFVYLMCSPDGRELWLFDRSQQRLTRYALPDAK